MKLKYLFQFVFSLVLGLALFTVFILLFVDSAVLSTNIGKLGGYLWSAFPYNMAAFSLPFTTFLVAVGIDKFKDKNSDYGDAQFASNRDIAKMHDNGLYEPTGTILGLKSNRFIRTSASLSTLIVAPQGTGKTAAIIIPTLLSNTSSFLINDIKGELWDKTSKQRANFGRVGIFAPSQSLHEGLCWNPLDERVMPKTFADRIDYVERIGSILYPTEQEGMNPTEKHFNAEGKSIFTYYAMMLIGLNDGTSLPEIYKVAMGSGDMQASIACDIDEYGESWDESLMVIANSILQKGGNEFQSSVTTFKQALEPFSRPNIARNLERCDFTHLDFKSDKPFSLYLFIPANDVKRMAPIVRMLVEYLVNEFLSLTDQSIINAQHVVFAMDEFPRMGYMQALKEAPALQRSYQMSSLFVAQDKNQLENTYGKGSFDQFVTTTDFKVIFRQNEDTTAARFSNLVGKTTKRKKSVSKRDLELLGSTSESKEGLPLILPQDFMNQKKNELVVLVSGNYERPIKCRCAWWFEDRNMRKLIGAYNGLTVSDLGQVNNNTPDNLEQSTNIVNDNNSVNETNDKSVSTETSIESHSEEAEELEEVAEEKIAELQLVNNEGDTPAPLNF